ncbi:MAG TPA: phage gp6-like head-tail connector protein [Candidatus Caccovivens faecavium]|nr:phage gp6-like head-tail connector protein [Candidatus Caccovivens faecavium]
MPTVEEMKVYLGIDGDYLDSLILDFINLAQNIIEKVLRYPLSEFEEIPATIKETAKYIVSAYYTNREQTNVKELENNVAVLLSEYRRKEF